MTLQMRNQMIIFNDNGTLSLFEDSDDSYFSTGQYRSPIESLVLRVVTPRKREELKRRHNHFHQFQIQLLENAPNGVMQSVRASLFLRQFYELENVKSI